MLVFFTKWCHCFLLEPIPVTEHFFREALSHQLDHSCYCRFVLFCSGKNELFFQTWTWKEMIVLDEHGTLLRVMLVMLLHVSC